MRGEGEEIRGDGGHGCWAFFCALERVVKGRRERDGERNTEEQEA